MKKPKKYSNEIKEKFYLADEIEAYHKWVLEPIVEVFKAFDHLIPLLTDEKFITDDNGNIAPQKLARKEAWEAISKTLKRSEG